MLYRGYVESVHPKVATKVSPYREVSNPGIIRLPDNSTVILRPGSKIRYADSFTSSKREVYLEGEAFFEVTKDARRPFIVRTEELITKVLGTSFSVKAYKNDKAFSVKVNTGKVSVFAKKTGSEKEFLSQNLESGGVLITPNQEVTFHRQETRLVKKRLEIPTDLSIEVAEEKLEFVDTPFSQVITAINKAYDIQIKYDEEKIGNCPLTASLSRQQLYEKLDLICRAVEASYSIENGNIVIKGKGCN
nr:FecR domain-containing protein [Pedobacter sp. SYSU D00535]